MPFEVCCEFAVVFTDRPSAGEHRCCPLLYHLPEWFRLLAWVHLALHFVNEVEENRVFILIPQARMLRGCRRAHRCWISELVLLEMRGTCGKFQTLACMAHAFVSVLPSYSRRAQMSRAAKEKQTFLFFQDEQILEKLKEKIHRNRPYCLLAPGLSKGLLPQVSPRV